MSLEQDKIRARAKNNAYMLLRLRPRSESEIAKRLKLKGYEDSIIDEVLESLRSTGDIDDRKFTKFWIESRMHLNPVGDIILRNELREKGIKDTIIDSALEEHGEGYDEYDTAFAMAKERFGRFSKLDKRKALKRVYDFLARRGFKFETINRIIDELIKEKP